MDHRVVEAAVVEVPSARPFFAYEAEVCRVRRERNSWTITYRDSVIRLRDCLGIRYLVHLLRHPGRLFLAYDLARLAPATASSAEACERERVVEIRSELEEA